MAFASCREVVGQERILEEQFDAMNILGVKKVLSNVDLPVRELDVYRKNIRDMIFSAIDNVQPQLVLTHSPQDLHSDHRVVGKETVSVCRHLNVWCYEIIRSDSPEWRPNIYYCFGEDVMRRKLEALMCYESQVKRGWYTKDNFRDWGKMRGIQAGGEYAEAFWSPRICLNKLPFF